MLCLYNSKPVFLLKINQFGNNRKEGVGNTITSKPRLAPQNNNRNVSSKMTYTIQSRQRQAKMDLFYGTVVGPLGFVVWHPLGLGWGPYPQPHPTPLAAQLVFGCGAEERLLHNTTQQERDRLWQQGPQRSNPAAVKGISWYVPTLPLTKSQVVLEKWQDQLADLCTCVARRQHCLQQKKKRENQGPLRTNCTLQCSVTRGEVWNPFRSYWIPKWTRK